MKKGVLAGIIILALVIIVSPGIIGKLSEQSLDENLNRAVDHSAEFVVTSDGFDRGWFSSQGEHRIELGEGPLRDSMMDVSGGGGTVPALVISTTIDHGIIPVTSMTRDKGSLAPGLGSAVSTLRLDSGDGESFDLPGAIYSTIALNGDLKSQYLAEAGTYSDGEDTIEWQSSKIDFTSDASSGAYTFNGGIGSVEMTGSEESASIGPITFSGDQFPSGHGFFLGDIELTMSSIEIAAGGDQAVNIDGITVAGDTVLDEDRAVGDVSMTMNKMSVPQFGDVSLTLEMKSDVDAASLGVLMDAIDRTSGSNSQADMLALENPAKDLVAAGLDIDLPRFNVELPMGTVETALTLSVPEMDRDSFEWTSLLLKGQASLDLRVPSTLVDMATAMNPQAGAIVGLGYLKKDGDDYVMDADMEQGLLTVNGAPIPIPLGAF